MGGRNHRTAWRTALVGVVGVSGMAAGACVPPGPDTTPPVLEAPAAASFVVGAQVGRTVGDPYEFTTGIPARIDWTSTDPGSGVCNAAVDAELAGGPPTQVDEGASLTSYSTTESDYEDQFGGGSSKVIGWDVTVTDCAGNAATSFVRGRPRVVQEDGADLAENGPALPPAYSGAWSGVACDCSGGAVASTDQAGASVAVTNPGPSPLEVGLVMRTGPDRGRATVQVDGSGDAVLDLQAATPADRVVVWEGRLAPGAAVRLVNEGTAGRPRIDLDAILLR